MPPPAKTVRESLVDDFQKIIMRFSLNDLKNSVPPAFDDDEFTWELIMKAMKKYNLSTRKQDLALLFIEYTKPMETKEVQQIYGNLVLQELMLYPHKKTWTSVCMRQENQTPADSEIIQSIIRNFLEIKIKLNVHSDISGNIRWFALLIKKKKRNNETPLQRPIYLAHPLNTSYVFFAPQRISSDLLKVFVKALGYDNLKVVKLNGKDIPSLVSMLDRRKDADQVRARTSLALKNMTDVVAVKSSRGIDFCQDKIRSDHAKEILGNDSIQLQSLVVHAKTEWRGLRTLPEAEGMQVDMSLKISSKNVNSSLQELIKAGVILPPYPVWIKEFFISGKNVLHIG